MAVLSFGLTALLGACSTTCQTCGTPPVRVGEREGDDGLSPVGESPVVEAGGSYNPMISGWQRTWPYGPTTANPPWQ